MSVNKIILVGHLGKDPERRYTPSGTAVTNFTMATSERYKDRDGRQQEKTEWHNIVAWNKLADICADYLHKGSQIYIEGKITTRKWQDRDGMDRYTTEIVANQLQMLGKPERSGPSDSMPDLDSRPGKPTVNKRNEFSDDFDQPLINPDDDIPF